EGDQLMFRVLDNGDILEKARDAADTRQLVSRVSSKALRYDLTIPFARFVVMNQHQLIFPFRRYQIQPVWRADRPQKSRYREFFQCDADIIGTDSLLCEIELLQLLDEALSALGLKDSGIRINHRSLLAGLAGLTGRPEMLPDIMVAIDKLDKIGWEGVSQELLLKGMDNRAIQVVANFIAMKGDHSQVLQALRALFPEGSPGHPGLLCLAQILENSFAGLGSRVQVDLSLARGLHYYTGTIIEAQPPAGVKTGSIAGGGRYDDLTGLFGLKGISGVGISFGVDRIYDALEELGLFPPDQGKRTRVLFLNLGQEGMEQSYRLLKALRLAGTPAEIYPSPAKMDRQLKYADKNGIPFVVMIGSSELEAGKLSLKDLSTGQQTLIEAEELLGRSF
ncbi:MAG TPA: histidine--tRNA ligase, partial [Chitinophagaceae bacterium]|nr:histidine--tRNA ligase [Chitinophagaceae bacterium]